MNLIRSQAVTPHVRQFSASAVVLGGVKMRRKKQSVKADNPHLPTRIEKTDKLSALSHFDQYYSQYFISRWPSMRLALLSRPKYCAVVNNFGDPEDTASSLERQGCINITKMFHERNQSRRVKLSSNESTVKTAEVDAPESTSLPEDEREDRHDPQHLDEEVPEPSFSLDVKRAHERYIDSEQTSVGETSSFLHDHVPTSTLKGMEDFVEESEYYKVYQMVKKDTISVRHCDNLVFPNQLQVYTFPRNVMEMFPAPSTGPSRNLNYYCLDGGSLFPVLALDLQPGQDVLDMCAGPGGKSLLALQTLYPRRLVCNDVNGQRLARVGSVMEQYCGTGSGMGNVRSSVHFSRKNGSELLDYGVYDRVLCDVPCFSDRHSVNSDEKNIFAAKMLKSRLKLPEEQCDLLKAGLMYLKAGGSLVYSTCTLSPIQNEGVVRMALKALYEETAYDFYVSDMTEALKPFRFLCKILGPKQGVNLGNLIVPHLSNNFGPTYFCKITRRK